MSERVVYQQKIYPFTFEIDVAKIDRIACYPGRWIECGNAKCREGASRFVRCLSKKHVIARCTVHGNRIAEQRGECCKGPR